MIEESTEEGLPISQLCIKLQQWLREKCPSVAAGLDVDGASDEEIQLIEEKLEISLPHSFKQFIRIFNGSNEVCVLPDFHAFLSLEESLESRNEMIEVEEGFNEYGCQPDAVIDDSYLFHPKWFPFAIENYSYHSIYCIDLSPGPAGKVGQVVRWLSDGCRPELVASSFHVWLQEYVDGCESGRYVFSDEAECIVDMEKEKERRETVAESWCSIC